MSTTTSSLKMKLLVDTTANRVVFAEADKGVVDFLFSLLALPVATIVEMLGTGSMHGSFGNLYGSVEKLDDTYVLPGAKKEAVLQPTVVASAARSLLLPAPPSSSSSDQAKSFFKCSNMIYNSCPGYVTDTRGTKCPSCGNKMNTALKFVAPVPEGSDVQKASSIVQGVVTYTVRDDLTVTPMSTISGMTMLNTAGVTDFAALQEKTVQLGYTEVGDDEAFVVC
jgi:hypothetical protein